MIFLRLASPAISIKRVAVRVRQGGHDVPREDILRRFERGLKNFAVLYKPLADSWVVYDNSENAMTLVEVGP